MTFLAHLQADIATLSRMTGKDFSGPTPEIRAPTPIRMPETPQSQDASEPRSNATRPAADTTDGVEIVGEVSEIAEQH